MTVERESKIILDKLADKAEIRFLQGAYRGLDEFGRAIVDFSGGRVPAHILQGPPAVNDTVWVQVANGVAYMHGPTVPKPTMGTVESAISGVAQLTTRIGPVSAAYDDGLLLLDPGDVVRVLWDEHGAWVLGVAVEATAPDVPVAPGGSGGRKTAEFVPVDSGSWQAGFGWRTLDVWSSANNKGAWFYGTQIADTIPDSAVIVGEPEIFLPNPTKQTGARPFGRHAYASKPSGEPTITATSTLPGTSGWVKFPTSLIEHLRSNVGGLGFDLGGWWIWPAGGQAGTVRVTYET